MSDGKKPETVGERIKYLREKKTGITRETWRSYRLISKLYIQT